MSIVTYLGLGSNVGDRVLYLTTAVSLLRKFIDVKNVSSIYESLSLEKDEQRNYFNIVIEADVNTEPPNLLKKIKTTELQMGRLYRGRHKEREIDIDIIDMCGISMTTDILTIPHIDMHRRSFVLYPLFELNPNYIHPTIKKSIKQLIEELKDDLNIKLVGEI